MSSVTSVNILEDHSANPPFSGFDGVEKLLEIWFAESSESETVRDPLGLRGVKREIWEEMLDLVRCKVLSVINGDEVDAYLLSESSMFVWPHKIILKTCGTTTLLLGLRRMLEIAKEHCGFQAAWRCFYSRKAFMFPERQIGPHKTWDDEVKYLDREFGNGSAYVVGKMNGDHWLLYLTAPKDEPLPEVSANDRFVEDVLATSTSPPSTSFQALSVSQRQASKPPSPPDQTLEILMTKLDPVACEAFYYPVDASVDGESDESQQGHATGSQLSQRLGIDALLAGSTLDSFLFTPCGYSANIVKDDRYATIHVTPEKECSYASFECNFDFRGEDAEHAQANGAKPTESSLHELIGKVLAIFRPQRLSITLFVSVEETASGQSQGTTPETRTILDPKVAEGYKRTDRILYEFAGYHLLFSTYEKL